MSNLQRPRRVSTTHVEDLHGEICIYEWTTKTVHALSPTAARVWQLCDGGTTVSQMVDSMRSEFGDVSAPTIVWLALQELGAAGLLDGAPPPDRAVVSRRAILRTAGLTAALPIVTSIVAPTPLAAQSLGPRTFEFTGAAQSFTVPTSVTSIHVDVIGASGAGLFPVNAPGLRGRVEATLAVTPGEILTILVAGLGSLAGSGGFVGGGSSGQNGVYGGGGASEIRRGSTQLVVAGGGGGGGLNGGNGGHGGGLTGTAGTGTCGGGGGGGSQSVGGAGGAAGAGGQAGTAGTLGLGGHGADATGVASGGGGGGGGYYGGGGGGSCGTAAGGGAGGGGSSYSAIGVASAVVHTQGFGTGNGRITITW